MDTGKIAGVPEVELVADKIDFCIFEGNLSVSILFLFC